MSLPISHELVITPKGRFIVSGNPSLGYDVVRVDEVMHFGNFRRKWQAVAAAHGEEVD